MLAEGAAGEDFVDHDNDPMDRHGHGTHVAGIAGAASNNGIGIAGVAWNCKIMPVRAGFKTPSGDGVLESDDAAQAIVYAAENGAKALNLSWGDYQKSSLIEDAIQFAADQGALICAAAGNENSSSLLSTRRPWKIAPLWLWGQQTARIKGHLFPITGIGCMCRPREQAFIAHT